MSNTSSVELEQMNNEVPKDETQDTSPPTIAKPHVVGRFSVGDKVKLINRHDWITSNSKKGSIGIITEVFFSYPRFVAKVKVKNGYYNGYEYWWQENITLR